MSSENKENQYVVLAECNGKEYETWYYFIKVNGNEKALEHLDKQLKSVEFYIIDDLSTFDLDMDHPMSESTAKQMIRLEVNSFMDHRMFEGKLQMIDLNYKKNESNDKKIVKTFKKLGIGRIDRYVDGEYIDPERVKRDSKENSNSDSEEEPNSEDYEYDISEEEESSSEDDARKKKQQYKNKKQEAKEKLMKRLRELNINSKAK